MTGFFQKYFAPIIAWLIFARLSTLALSAQASEPSGRLVLLFDKRCPLCRACVPYSEARRHAGQATLTLLERSAGNFIVRKIWQATYGLSEGPKACLNDNRTPEGFYHTTLISRNRDSTYGYIAILISYPSSEDIEDLTSTGAVPADKCLCKENGKVRNRQWNMCSRTCTDPGAGIAIHGGHAGQTRGCIRVLDPGTDPRQYQPIHSKAIAELASFVEQEPGARVPLISVIDAAEGCRSDLEHPVSRGCAEALRAIVDSARSPSRDQVERLMSEARGLPVRRPKAPLVAEAPPAAAQTVAPAALAVPAASLPPPGPVLRRIDVQSVLASSEARDCGTSGNEPCSASSLSALTSERAWCEAISGTGEGQWLRFVFTNPHAVARIELQNGFWEKGAGSPSWFERGYVTAVELVVDGKSTLCSHPQEDPTQLDCELDGTVGRSLLLRIKSAAPGELTEQTCVSHVSILTPDASP